MRCHVAGRRGGWAVELRSNLFKLLLLSCTAGCGDEPRLGHASVNAAVVDATRCPTIQATVAEPGQVYVGGMIYLRVVATAAKSADALTYAWSPAAGIIEATAARAVYPCAAAGTQTVTVKVTEAVGAGACSAQQALPVDCLPGQPP